MAYRYEFYEAAAKDLEALTRRDPKLLIAIVTRHIPAILNDPRGAGDKKKGSLNDVYGYDLNVGRIAYRLLYLIEPEDVIVFVAIGPHDTAYERITNRIKGVRQFLANRRR